MVKQMKNRETGEWHWLCMNLGSWRIFLRSEERNVTHAHLYVTEHLLYQQCTGLGQERLVGHIWVQNRGLGPGAKVMNEKNGGQKAELLWPTCSLSKNRMWPTMHHSAMTKTLIMPTRTGFSLDYPLNHALARFGKVSGIKQYGQLWDNSQACIWVFLIHLYRHSCKVLAWNGKMMLLGFSEEKWDIGQWKLAKVCIVRLCNKI